MDIRASGAQFPASVCFYCNRQLEPIHDYSCVDCGRLTCDNHCEICDDWDCGLITCVRCIEPHMRAEHPWLYVSLLADVPDCG